MDKQAWITKLQLEAHPLEGGYFRRTYESEHFIGERKLLTSIYYMLTDDSPIGYMHRNRSDILHYYHAGSSLRYLLLDEAGHLQEQRLGIDAGASPQLLVPGGVWKIAILEVGEYSLISEAVSPGFEYRDNTLAKVEEIQALYPDLYPEIQQWIKV